MNRKELRKDLLVLTVIIVVPLALMICRARYSLYRYDEICKLGNICLFFSNNVECAGIYEFEQNSKYYILWTLPFPKADFLASGGAGYIFDESGNLIDSHPDLGSATPFLKKWAGVQNKTKVDPKEIIIRYSCATTDSTLSFPAPAQPVSSAPKTSVSDADSEENGLKAEWENQGSPDTPAEK